MGLENMVKLEDVKRSRSSLYVVLWLEKEGLGKVCVVFVDTCKQF